MNKFVFSFIFFSFFWSGMATLLTRLDETCDLFDVQTSAGSCWKGNALQNKWASLDFRQMALQVRPESEPQF